MMASTIYLLVYLCSTLNVGLSFIPCSRYKYPEDRKHPTDCNRLTPIALMTKNATVVRAPKLSITISRNSIFTFTNTGTNVIAAVPSGSASATGGPMYNDEYDLVRIYVLFDGVPSATRVTFTQDGEGYPCTVVLQFLNKAYENPLDQSDGVMKIHMPVLVEGEAPNPKFEPFLNLVVQNIKTPNATANITAENFLPWVLETFSSPYFSYPSSKDNDVTGEQVPNTIAINQPLSRIPYISHSQFYRFINGLKNSVGQPLVYAHSLHEQLDMPIVHVISPVKIKYTAKYPLCRIYN